MLSDIKLNGNSVDIEGDKVNLLEGKLTTKDEKTNLNIDRTINAPKGLLAGKLTIGRLTIEDGEGEGKPTSVLAQQLGQSIDMIGKQYLRIKDGTILVMSSKSKELVLAGVQPATAPETTVGFQGESWTSDSSGLKKKTDWRKKKSSIKSSLDFQRDAVEVAFKASSHPPLIEAEGAEELILDFDLVAEVKRLRAELAELQRLHPELHK